MSQVKRENLRRMFFRSGLRPFDPVHEGSKQRQPEYEVKVNIAANGVAKIARRNIGQPQMHLRLFWSRCSHIEGQKCSQSQGCWRDLVDIFKNV
jgi:hypothetical protein